MPLPGVAGAVRARQQQREEAVSCPHASVHFAFAGSGMHAEVLGAFTRLVCNLVVWCFLGMCLFSGLFL